MKTSSLFKLLFVSLLSSGLASTAMADQQDLRSSFPEPKEVTNDEQYKPHIGFMLGFSNPESNYDSAEQFGVDIGLQPYIPFGLSVLALYSEFDPDNANNENLERTAILAKGTYNFAGNIPVLNKSYVGVAAGPAYENANDSDIALALAPMAGFDIPLSALNVSEISAGLNTKYLMTSSSSPESFSLHGTVKYWF